MNMIPDEGKYSLKRYKGIITTLIIAIVVFFALWRLDSVVAVANKYLGYISPVIYGVSIAYVLNPAVVYFERLLGARFMKAKSEKTRAKADRLAKKPFHCDCDSACDRGDRRALPDDHTVHAGIHHRSRKADRTTHKFAGRPHR